jgi:hypothetical protein
MYCHMRDELLGILKHSEDEGYTEWYKDMRKRVQAEKAKEQVSLRGMADDPAEVAAREKRIATAIAEDPSTFKEKPTKHGPLSKRPGPPAPGPSTAEGIFEEAAKKRAPAPKPPAYGPGVRGPLAAKAMAEIEAAQKATGEARLDRATRGLTAKRALIGAGLVAAPAAAYGLYRATRPTEGG